jgi:hypothetical protein
MSVGISSSGVGEGRFDPDGAGNRVALSVTSRRPAVRAAVDERAVATAFKAPIIPHRTCHSAGILSGAVLFLGCLTFQRVSAYGIARNNMSRSLWLRTASLVPFHNRAEEGNRHRVTVSDLSMRCKNVPVVCFCSVTYVTSPRAPERLLRGYRCIVQQYNAKTCDSVEEISRCSRLSRDKK